jgi:hypothetical protein
MPSAVVAQYLSVSYKEWHETPGRHGQQRKGRFMSPRHPATGFKDGWMNQYRDRWDLIVGVVAGQPGGQDTG